MVSGEARRKDQIIREGGEGSRQGRYFRSSSQERRSEEEEEEERRTELLITPSSKLLVFVLIMKSLFKINLIAALQIL